MESVSDDGEFGSDFLIMLASHHNSGKRALTARHGRSLLDRTAGFEADTSGNAFKPHDSGVSAQDLGGSSRFVNGERWIIDDRMILDFRSNREAFVPFITSFFQEGGAFLGSFKSASSSGHGLILQRIFVARKWFGSTGPAHVERASSRRREGSR